MEDYYWWRWLLTHIIDVRKGRGDSNSSIDRATINLCMDKQYTVEDIRKEEVVMYQSYERRENEMDWTPLYLYSTSSCTHTDSYNTVT